MTWLFTAWRWLSGSALGRACAAVAAVLFALWLAYVRGRSSKAKDMELGAHREAQERRDDAREAGIEAAREAGNMSPDDLRERMRRSGRWGNQTGGL